jgi:hypothetical protein
MSDTEKSLVALAKENPFRFFATEELSVLTGLSVDAIRLLMRKGAPFVSKKSRPELLMEWLTSQRCKVEDSED